MLNKGNASSKNQEISESKYQKSAIVLIILLSVLAYANTLGNGFVWDDWGMVYNNQIIKSWANFPKVFVLNVFQDEGNMNNYCRPLLTISYMLDNSLYKLNPSGYHLTSLVFHIAAGIMIYFFTFSLFADNKLAFFTGLLFAVHPIHTEAVGWIAARGDVMFTFFFFTCLYLHLQMQTANNKNKQLMLCLSLLSFLLGLYSKEIMLILPIMLILVDFYRNRNLKHLRSQINNWLPYWGLAVFYFFIRSLVFGFKSSFNPYLEPLARHQILLTFGRAIIYYLTKLIYPINLSAHIAIDLVHKGLPWDVLAAIIILILSLTYALLSRKKDPEISFAILFFWVSLAPLSNLVPISYIRGIKFPMAERYLYFPSYGYCLLVAGLLCKLNKFKTRHLALGTVVFFLMLIFYTAGTVYANSFWESDFILFKKEARISPNNYFVNYNIGSFYLDRREYALAINHLEKAARIEPDEYSHFKLAACYYEMGNYPKAIAENLTALRFNKNLYASYFNMGICYKELKKYDLAAQAFQNALRINPRFNPARQELNVIRGN
ncbi:MAG: tetratricopeptide repeat protein [Candidatus Schekmanbacteria bacterium]|nr:tetratricopeptide repeat protein [Candidatus Schekmanbacteria bacterium]